MHQGKFFKDHQLGASFIKRAACLLESVFIDVIKRVVFRRGCCCLITFSQIIFKGDSFFESCRLLAGDKGIVFFS